MRRGLAFGLLALAACQAPRTELILGVATDLHAPTDLDHVHLQLSVDEVVFHEEDWEITGRSATDFNLPGSFGIYPDGDHDRIGIKLIGSKDGTERVVREAVISFVPDHTTFYRMGLTGACMAMTCPSGQTCVEGACQALELDATKFPAFDEALVTTLSCQTPTTPAYADTGTGVLMPPAPGAASCPGSLCAEGTCLVPPHTGGAQFEGVVLDGLVDLSIDHGQATATVWGYNDPADPTMGVGSTICTGPATASTFSLDCGHGITIVDGSYGGGRAQGTVVWMDPMGSFSLPMQLLDAEQARRYCGTYAGADGGPWSFVAMPGAAAGGFTSDGSGTIDLGGGALTGTLEGASLQLAWTAMPGTASSGTASGTISADGADVTGTWSATTTDGTPGSGTFHSSEGACAPRP